MQKTGRLTDGVGREIVTAIVTGTLLGFMKKVSMDLRVTDLPAQKMPLNIDRGVYV
jgi:hypothetical protein